MILNAPRFLRWPLLSSPRLLVPVRGRGRDRSLVRYPRLDKIDVGKSAALLRPALR